jgi:putative transposase
MSDATLYNWKAKYGGLEVSEAKRLRALEDENARLKRLLADAMLDASALKDLLAKKWQGPPPSARLSLIFGPCSR